MKTKQRGLQEWWATLSPGERRLIRSVMEVLRGAKGSQVAEVARAARDWERGIGFFIKVQLMSGRTRRNRRWTINHSPTAKPSPISTTQGDAQR